MHHLAFKNCVNRKREFDSARIGTQMPVASSSTRPANRIRQLSPLIRALSDFHRKQLYTRPTKSHVPHTNGQRTVQNNRDWPGSVFQEFGGVKVAVSCKPRRGQIRPIGQQAEMCDEPHPVPSHNKCQTEGNSNTEQRTTPEREQWMRIGFKQAVGQVPGQQVGLL